MKPAAMRVLIVVEATDGGVGRHAIDLSAGLGQRGHDVHTIYSPKRADVSLVDNEGKSAGELASTDALRARLASSN